jgi:hypothetical protein
VLVTVTELQNYMDIRFSNRQEQAAEYVLEGLQSELESYLGRPVEVQEFTEIYTMPNNHIGIPLTSFLYDWDDVGDDGATREMGMIAAPPPTIYLENSPVVSVESVTITRPNEPNTPVEQLEHRDYVVRKYGIDLYTAFANDKVTVEYTAGLDGSSIKSFKLMILRAATREMQNMHDDVVGIKDLETRNVAPLETGFLEKELMALKKWRRVRI